jgi:hypothetical protein
MIDGDLQFGACLADFSVHSLSSCNGNLNFSMDLLAHFDVCLSIVLSLQDDFDVCLRLARGLCFASCLAHHVS